MISRIAHRGAVQRGERGQPTLVVPGRIFNRLAWKSRTVGGGRDLRYIALGRDPGLDIELASTDEPRSPVATSITSTALRAFANSAPIPTSLMLASASAGGQNENISTLSGGGLG